LSLDNVACQITSYPHAVIPRDCLPGLEIATIASQAVQ
jgi:hypothetical protein